MTSFEIIQEWRRKEYPRAQGKSWIANDVGNSGICGERAKDNTKIY